VDRLSVLQEAIDRTHIALSGYPDPHHGIHEIHGTDIMTSRNEGERGWTMGSLQRILVEIAESHTEVCDSEDCRTCPAIAEGLTVSLAALRWLHEEELEARLAEVGP
jgi:hypothetical protein